MKLAMLLAVYHEEANIRACIEHHKPFVDEVVCVHDGPCSDGTANIAIELGAHYMRTEEHYGYCEPVREYGRQKALMLGCSWAIVVDADEKFDKEYLGNLRRLVADADRTGEVALITNRLTHFLPVGTREDLTWDLQMRTFKLTQGHFTDIIHTNVTMHGGEVAYLPTEFFIEHWCFYDVEGKKSRRYQEIARKLMLKYSGDANVVKHLTTALGGAA